MNGELHVERCGPDDVRVAAWLAGRRREGVYAMPWFHHFVAAAVAAECRYLVVCTGDDVRGVLPYCRRRGPAGREVVNSLPWYGSHGGCIGAEDPATSAALLAAFADEMRQLAPLTWTLSLSVAESARAEHYVEVLAPSEIEWRVTQVSNLPAAGRGADDALLAMMTQKTRNLVRKSLRQGFVERLDDSEDAWRFLHRVHAEHMAGIGGRAKPWAHFEAMRAMVPPECRRLSVAESDGERVAALLLLMHGDTVEYLTPVSVAEQRSRQPLSFLIWEALRAVVARGFTIWNWGGTWRSQVSLHHFKAGWGAVDIPYCYVIGAAPDALAWLRAHRDRLGDEFPWFYVYPYERIAA